MDVLFGFVGDGFTLLVSDTNRVQSIVVQRTEVDKILQLDSHKMMVIYYFIHKFVSYIFLLYVSDK